MTNSSVSVKPTPFLRTQKVKGASTPRKYTTETPIHAEEEVHISPAAQLAPFLQGIFKKILIE